MRVQERTLISPSIGDLRTYPELMSWLLRLDSNFAVRGEAERGNELGLDSNDPGGPPGLVVRVAQSPRVDGLNGGAVCRSSQRDAGEAVAAEGAEPGAGDR
jgi:hypothetical protein